MIVEFKGIPPLEAGMAPVGGTVKGCLYSPHLTVNNLYIKVAAHTAVGTGGADYTVGPEGLDGITV